jgi:hypothetical protein
MGGTAIGIPDPISSDVVNQLFNQPDLTVRNATLLPQRFPLAAVSRFRELQIP